MTRAHPHRQINLQFDVVEDADILERLAVQPSKVGYVRRLVRRDIDAWNHRATPTTHAVIVSDESTDCATGHCECELCGEPIDPWDKYCRHCGARCVG